MEGKDNLFMGLNKHHVTKASLDLGYLPAHSLSIQWIELSGWFQALVALHF